MGDVIPKTRELEIATKRAMESANFCLGDMMNAQGM